MQCSLDAKRTIQKNLREEATELKDKIGVISSSGESVSLAIGELENAIRKIGDPTSVYDYFAKRATQRSNPFYRNLIKQLSEEITIKDSEGRSVDMFVMDGFLTTGRPNELTLVVARSTDPSSSERIVFDINGENGTSTSNGKEYSFKGLKSIVSKAVKGSDVESIQNTEVEVSVSTRGNRELETTLDRMVEANAVLGSTENVTPESLRGYEQIRDYVHGNLESMRELMLRLHVLGNSKAPAELLDYYNSLIDKLHPSFFNKMSIYIQNNAPEAYGQVFVDSGAIGINIAPNDTAVENMSEAEVYMHEVVHTMVSWALRQGVHSTDSMKRQITELMKIAKENVTWEDLLPVTRDVASERQIKRAKEQEKYIFASKHSVEEFIAFGLTNPRFMEKLQDIKIGDQRQKPTTLFGKLASFFTQLVDTVLGRFSFRDNDATVYSKLNELTFALAEVNNKHISALDKMNPLGKIMDAFEDVDSYLGSKLMKARGKLVSKNTAIEVIPEDAGLYEQAKFYLSIAIKALTNPIYRGAVGQWASALGMSPDGTIREIIGNLFDKDEASKLASRISLYGSKYDAIRNSIVDEQSRILKESFNTPLTAEEDANILTTLIDTNVSSLMYNRGRLKKYSKANMQKLLTDESYLRERIGRITHAIEEEIGDADEKRQNWTKAQAQGLGYFMHTHQTHPGQVLNSYGISKGFGLGTRYKTNEHLEHLIGELASLHALSYVDQFLKKDVADKLVSEIKGIRTITDSYEAYKQNTRDTVFKEARGHILEGHSKELFDDTIELIIAPVADKLELEGKGFIKRYDLNDKGGVSSYQPLAVYTTNSLGRAERMRGAVNVGTHHARGMTLREAKRIESPEMAEALFSRDFAKIARDTLSIHEQMQNGTFDVTKVTRGLAPVYNNSGQVVDYRFMMDKESKADLLKQDRRATKVLPQSAGSIEHQIRAVELDKIALNALKKDMEENWTSGTVGDTNLTEYALIGPNSEDKAMRELYYMLPETLKEFVDSRADKTLAVRRKHLPIYFGYKHLQLSEYPVVKMLPPVVKQMMDTAEGWWLDLVKVSKSSTLLKLPKVVVDNIISNIFYIVFTGDLNIKQIAADHIDATRDLDRYLKDRSELSRLEQEVELAEEAMRRVGNRNALGRKIHNNKIEIGRLKSTMEYNPAHELFEAGMYQSHIIDVAGSTLEETNRITQAGNKLLRRAPKAVQTVFNMAYLTQETPYFHAVQEIMQRSDMISRMVDSKRQIRRQERMIAGEKRLPQWWVEEKGKDYPSKKRLSGNEEAEFRARMYHVRLDTITDNFVNYALPNGKFEEHLNRLGVLQFTKYLKRVQRIILDSSMQNPLKFALMLGFMHTVWDAPRIHDSSAAYRAVWGNSELFGIVPMYSPMYHLTMVGTPAVLREDWHGFFF